MRWDIEDKVGRIDLWLFTGVNFGGMRKIVRIHPYGGLQGADVDGSEIKSMGVIAEPGVRVILRTASTSMNWEGLPWRCIQVLEGHTGKLSDGRTCVQIPDLDTYNEPTARRTDPEVEEAFPAAETLAEGVGWTFGRAGKKGLKCNIKSIRVEKIPDPTAAAEAAEAAPEPGSEAPAQAEVEAPDAVTPAVEAAPAPSAPVPAAPVPAAAAAPAAPAAASPTPRPDTPSTESGRAPAKKKDRTPEATIPTSDSGPGSTFK